MDEVEARGAPQLGQKRASGVAEAPHLAQNIGDTYLLALCSEASTYVWLIEVMDHSFRCPQTDY